MEQFLQLWLGVVFVAMCLFGMAVCIGSGAMRKREVGVVTVAIILWPLTIPTVFLSFALVPVLYAIGVIKEDNPDED